MDNVTLCKVDSSTCAKQGSCASKSKAKAGNTKSSPQHTVSMLPVPSAGGVLASKVISPQQAVPLSKVTSTICVVPITELGSRFIPIPNDTDPEPEAAMVVAPTRTETAGEGTPATDPVAKPLKSAEQSPDSPGATEALTAPIQLA